jgi:hypothetical protein
MANADPSATNGEAAAAHGSPLRPEPGPIEKPQNIWVNFMLPMLATIVVAFGIAFLLPIFAFDCNTTHLFQALLIAFACAMAAVILGGRAGVIFDIPVLQRVGARVAISVVGGFAAFVIGMVLAYVFQSACTWASSIRIDKIELTPPDDGDKRSPFVTVLVAGKGDGDDVPPYWKPISSYPDASLQLTLPSKGVTLRFTGFAIVKDDTAKDSASISYKYLGTCTVHITATSESNEPTTDVAEHDGIQYKWLQYKSEQFAPNGQLSLVFRKSYFDELEKANKDSNPNKVKDQCLAGDFRPLGGSQADQPWVTVTPPLHVSTEYNYGVLPRLRYGFTKRIAAASGDEKRDTMNAARTAVAAEDVVGPPQTLPTPAARADAATSTVTALPPAKPLEAAANCIQESGLKAQVVAYLEGSDLDRDARFNLYNHWPGISCLTGQIVGDDKNRFSSGNRARAVRLLASTVINYPDTYWQPIGPKRDFTKPVPSYFDDTLRKRIFDLLASDDDTIRAEAVRLVKLLPNDQFESLFQSRLAEMQTWKGLPAIRERYAIAANALYYNRIVEWLNVPDDDKANQKSATQAQVGKDFANGEQWMHDQFFVGRSSQPFSAMLLYAKGIVEREVATADDFGKATFTKMVTKLEATGEPYPSRALHVAQALLFSSGVIHESAEEKVLLNTINNAVEVDIGRVLDEGSGFGTSPYPLFIAPNTGRHSSAAHVQVSDKARLLLHSSDGEWFLVAAKGKIGWIHRAARS